MFKTIYSALYRDDCHPFNVLAEKVEPAREPEDLKETNSALVVWGGADINPEYYRHPRHHTTGGGGARDRAEWSLMNEAKDKGIPIIGVCRGAQMLCALAGGFLIQDVEGHHGYHNVDTKDDKTFTVNSIHHQMLCMAEMPESDYELVGWSSSRRSVTNGKPYYGYKDDQQFVPNEEWKEPEFVYFPKINGYAIQWHPEMMASHEAATQYVLEFIKRKEQERGDSFASITLTCDC